MPPTLVKSRKLNWASTLGLYQSFGEERVLGLEALSNGIGGAVPVADYGVQVKWISLCTSVSCMARWWWALLAWLTLASPARGLGLWVADASGFDCQWRRAATAITRRLPGLKRIGFGLRDGGGKGVAQDASKCRSG